MALALDVPVAVPVVVAVPVFEAVPVAVVAVVVLAVPVVTVKFEIADETTTEAEDRVEIGTWTRVVFTPAGMEGATVTTGG